MTVITKPITEKKADKVEDSLVDNEVDPDEPTKVDLEASTEPQYFILRTRARRVTTATTVCLFLTALLVMSIGIIGGVYLYRQFARSQIQRFRGWCSVPYDGSKAALYRDDPIQQNMHHDSSDSDLFRNLIRNQDMAFGKNDANKMANFFTEEFEMDLETDDFEKFDVPDFRGGRRGRFIHDFKANETGIIDLDSRRCFVMPLNRNTVLPPKSLRDLITKMRQGYYEVDTKVVRQTMRVVTPPIKDMRTVGRYISYECNYYPTYRLVKNTSPVYKRSVDDSATYSVFSGKNIMEVNLINLPEVLQFEADSINTLS